MRSRQQEQGLNTGFEIYNIMPTLAERIIQEGMQEGMQLGMQKVMEKVARNSLKAGLPLKTIVKITDLPLERINQLKLNITLENSSPVPQAGPTPEAEPGGKIENPARNALNDVRSTPQL